jgi:hypothetical protein
VRAHPPGVAPEALEECVTPSRALVCCIMGRCFVRPYGAFGRLMSESASCRQAPEPLRA